MRYFGSKFSTLQQLGELLRPRVPQGTFCDPFGGIGTVGAYFKTLGYKVWTGDILNFTHYFQVARIQHQRLPTFARVRNAHGLSSSADVLLQLSKGRQRDGWFVTNYAIKRRFFTIQNAREIARVWNKIVLWRRDGLLTDGEFAVLIASLIQAMDQVANTAGTYYAYLKTWHRKALRPFSMQLIAPARGPYAGNCVLGPAEEMSAKTTFDILYLDPPYNERSYGHYYHLPETMAVGGHPKIHGTSGIPAAGIVRSRFNAASQAAEALRTVIHHSNFRWLAFHYADNGLISKSTIREILSESGRIQEFELLSKGYTTQAGTRQVPHHLYLVKHA